DRETRRRLALWGPPPHVTAGAAVKAAAIADRRRDERMRQLQQDGAAPANHDDDLAVDLPGDDAIRPRVHTAMLAAGGASPASEGGEAPGRATSVDPILALRAD